MKAKLFLFYLRYRKPLILISSAIALISTSSYLWLEYKSRSLGYNPWQVVKVETGDRFTVTRNNETESIQLCGIAASGEEAKNYLRSLIDKGDGTVQLEETKGTYEAWMLLKPDYEMQIHLNTWMVEKGMTEYDRQSSRYCLDNEALEWAKELAKEDKVGIWQR